MSYLRKEFAATAERRSRPAKFAEAMVDVDVEIPDVVGKGKLLTLTASEAMGGHRVVEFKADSLEAALDAVGLGAADVRRTSQTWAETLVRFLTNPILASVLMTVGLLGILVEITGSPRVDVLRDDVDTVDRPSSVPEIVPGGSQNLASRANSSQVGRSRK